MIAATLKLGRRWGWGLATLVALCGLPGLGLGLTTTFVPTGSTWKYLDDGSNQGSAWQAPGFDDSGWAAGPAELGYGDSDEATVVGFGPNAAAKYITTYFRRSFNVTNVASYARVDLRLLRDDGAVVYLNGSEVFRSNMPGGAVGFTTLASSSIGGAAETQFVSAVLDPAYLVEGNNVLAVEIHQVLGNSTDISFDLELSGSDSPLARGPYLQMGTATSIVVRWRTALPSNSRVRYGASPASLTSIVDDAVLTTEHVVTVNGLSPDTTYYYSVGSSATTFAGGDSEHLFVTAPSTGTAKATRIWVVGDSGTADANAQAVRDAYDAFSATRATDLWLMLGDNAYNSGTDSEYQAAVFDTYPAQLRSSVLWPTIGNHDAVSADSATQSGPYYDIFTLPTLAQAGGVVSGTEAYYSFDYGNIHFICLDSQATSRLPGSAMLTWLADDLLATNADWTIAFWHHPPYSKGSHNSDSETELIEMRQNVLPILEANGVDLVLTGHSHSYERSVLLDAHYGLSTTLAGNMIVDGGDGRVGGNGAYTKATLGPAAHEGAVYVVAGSSGQISAAALNHPAMYVSLLSLGSVVLDVNHNLLNARFLNSSGVVADSFTMIKGGPLCGNGLKESGEQCDSTDLGAASCAAQGCSGGTVACGPTCLLDYSACTGCPLYSPTPTLSPLPSLTPTQTPTSTPTPTAPLATPTPSVTASSHDTVLRPVRPLRIVVPASGGEVLKSFAVEVINADVSPLREQPGHVVRLTVSPGDCPATTVDGLPDFDLRAAGAQDTVLLAGGHTKKAKIRLRINAAHHLTHNHLAPHRCTLQLTADFDGSGNQDPSPRNNSLPLEISIVDHSDPEATALHESLVRSARPIKLSIRRSATTASRTVRLVLTNADILPLAENPGHAMSLGVNAAATTCPPGTVTAIGPTGAVVNGGATVKGSISLSVDSSAFASAAGRALDRCVVALEATTGVPANVEPDASNNLTRLVIDVDDKTDY